MQNKVSKYVLFSVTMVTLCGIIITSCTKPEDEDPTGNYNCHCTITDATGTNTLDQPFTGVTRSQATTTCATMQTTYSSGSSSATCALN